MNTEIIFKITLEQNNKTEEIEFELDFDETGEITDGGSFNPTSGWTNYANFDQGWSEQDEELNELLLAIKDFSRSSQLEELVSDATKEDIGKTFIVNYYCDGYVTENKQYTFEVEITDVSITGNITSMLNKTQIENLEEELEKQTGKKVDHTDFLEYLDIIIEDAKDIQEFNSNVWDSLKQGILEDYQKNM